MTTYKQLENKFKKLKVELKAQNTEKLKQEDIDKLKQCILKSQKNYGIKYETGLPKLIIDLAEYWRPEWVEDFEYLIRRVKRGYGDTDHNNEEIQGAGVYCRIKFKKFMTLFYSRSEKIIYDLNIGDRK